MLKQQLHDQLKEAMKAQDELQKSVVRMLLSAITYFEIQKGGAGYSATDEDVISVIEKQVKQRKDSIEQFEKAGRQELADKEKEEMDILKKYLPEQLSEEEIKNLIQDAITQTGAKTPQDMGKVMGALVPQTKGKADGSLVSKLVKEVLTL